MAQCALGDRTAGALHLNELAAGRAGLLARLFPDAPVTRHNAEAIADRLPAIVPSVVLMNPPFSVSPGVNRMRHDADLRHLRSAFSMLPVGGRLAAITSANCIPGDAAWADAFERSRRLRGVLHRQSTGAPMHGAAPLSTPASPYWTRAARIAMPNRNRRRKRVLPTPPGCSPPFQRWFPPRLPVEVAARPAADLFGHQARATPGVWQAPWQQGNGQARAPGVSARRNGVAVSELTYEIVTATYGRRGRCT